MKKSIALVLLSMLLTITVTYSLAYRRGYDAHAKLKLNIETHKQAFLIGEARGRAETQLIWLREFPQGRTRFPDWELILHNADLYFSSIGVADDNELSRLVDNNIKASTKQE